MRSMMHAGSLYLVGMMGAGKSTVGRLLARRLKLRFLDCDQEIERRCGVKIPLIFEIEGEAGFRARETQVLAELAALKGVVLATGGGAVLAEENRGRLAEHGTVIYLRARPEDLYQRVRHDLNRPLLATRDPLRRLREMHAERDPLYASIADLVVDTGKQTVQALARELVGRLGEQWKASA
jgi:shikimate kinase